MRLDNGIVAYELAHNKYMEWICGDSSQRSEWVSAYETIETLFGFHSIPCDVATSVCGSKYQVTVYIKDERFDFTFTY